METTVKVWYFNASGIFVTVIQIHSVHKGLNVILFGNWKDLRNMTLPYNANQFPVQCISREYSNHPKIDSNPVLFLNGDRTNCDKFKCVLLKEKFIVTSHCDNVPTKEITHKCFSIVTCE